MTRYRAFIKANIYPQNKTNNSNDNYEIYIPEHISYDTKQDALTSEDRWDYSFGLNNNDVVILIRHITVIDDGYGEVRIMPEFCYDYNTFINLGGRIECITKDENIINIDRINENFNSLYPILLNDTSTQIHIEPTGIVIYESNKKDIQIPTPLNHIIQNSYAAAENNNCNRSLVAESFYKALDAFNPKDIKGKNCYITEDYISVEDFDSDNSENLLYDDRMQKVVNIDEWMKHCYDYTVEQKRKRKRALEKHGLLNAFNSLETYLQSHNTIRKIGCDNSKDWPVPYEIIECNLAYGYKLTGFEILENAVIWEITSYERPIKQNDCIRGIDNYYLMFTNGIIIEVAKRIDYEMLCSNILENNYESYSDKYVKISDIKLK